MRPEELFNSDSNYTYCNYDSIMELQESEELLIVKIQTRIASFLLLKGNIQMNSFLKWPGGKRWFVSRYKDIFPTQFNCYIEPFLGSASVFFHIEPTNAILSDTNSDLINLYVEMRDHPLELAVLMKKHNHEHCKEYYYSIRSLITDDKLERAARFLYLNRTCYNGMYRVNRKGEFNVPIGTKSKCDQDIDNFPDYSALLKKAVLYSCDFEESISRAKCGDLLFVDPPYAVANKQSSFINYNDKLFSWNDQTRLLTLLCDARSRGVSIIATNSTNSQISTMYTESGFHTKTVSRNCVMAANPGKRNSIDELLITSFIIDKDMGGR